MPRIDRSTSDYLYLDTMRNIVFLEKKAIVIESPDWPPGTQLSIHTPLSIDDCLLVIDAGYRLVELRCLNDKFTARVFEDWEIADIEYIIGVDRSLLVSGLAKKEGDVASVKQATSALGATNVSAEEVISKADNESESIASLLELQATVHDVVDMSLDDLQAILDGVNLAAAQVQDIQLQLHQSARTVNWDDVLMSMVMFLLISQGEILVAALITKAVIRSLLPLSAAMATKAGKKAISSALARQKIFHSKRISLRQRKRTKMKAEAEFLEKFNSQIDKIVTSGAKVIKQAKRPKKSDDLGGGVPQQTKSEPPVDLDAGSGENSSKKQEKGTSSDTPRVFIRVITQDYIYTVRRALHAVMNQFDRTVQLYCHGGPAMAGLYRDIEDMAMDIIDDSRNAIKGIKPDTEGQTNPIDLRNEIRFAAEAVIWALMLKDQLKNDIYKDRASAGPLSQIDEQKKIGSLDAESDLKEYLRGRLVNPSTGKLFDSNEELFTHLLAIKTYFFEDLNVSEGLFRTYTSDVNSEPVPTGQEDPRDASVN